MKRKRTTTLLCLLMVMFLLSQCYYDKFNELHPLDGYINTCDPSLENTYTSSINLIMRTGCVSCHSNSRHEGDVYLETFEQVRKEGTNGRLVGSVFHQNGFKAMPPGTQLRDCELEKIQSWVAAGMPE